MRWFIHVLIGVAVLLIAAVVFLVAPGRAADTCDGFISPGCCCTTGACFVIGRDEIIRLDEKRYRIVRTGEVVEARGLSPDGRVRRCTYDNVDGHFTRIGDPDAKTSCLYVTDTGV